MDIPVFPDSYLPWRTLGTVYHDGAAGDGSGQAGQGAAGQGQGQVQGAGPAPVTVDDNFTFIPPGGNAPVKYGDFMKGYMPRSEYDSQSTALREGQAFLLSIAQALDKSGIKLDAKGNVIGQQPQREPAAPAADPLAKLKGQAVVDGDTIAELVDHVQKGHIRPIVETVSKLVDVVNKLQARLDRAERGVGAIQGTTREASFSKQVDDALTGMGLDPKSEQLRSALTYLYLAHEGNDLDAEFPKMSKAHVEGLRKLFREMDKKEADDARNRPWTPPKGGNANPQGKDKYKFQRGADIAKQIFGNRSANT